MYLYILIKINYSNDIKLFAGAFGFKNYRPCYIRSRQHELSLAIGDKNRSCENYVDTEKTRDVCLKLIIKITERFENTYLHLGDKRP